MSESEKLIRAKIYVDKLANGINPIDDSEIPADNLINDVRLSRCFFFLSDILRQVIESDSAGAKNPKPKKCPFEVSFEARTRFSYSEAPLTISEISKRINELIDEDRMQKLSNVAILTWLGEIGLLEWVSTSDGHRVRRPTQLGHENGISTEERVGKDRMYFAVVYNEMAQHFIVDNLDSIVTEENAKASLRGTPWTKEQETHLVELYQKNVPMHQIAAKLRRNTSAVRKRLRKLGFDLD